MPEVWATTDFSEMPNTPGDARVAAALRDEREDLAAAGAELLHGVVAAGEHRRDHLRVECDAVLCHPAEIPAEARGVGDPLLEQVADRRRPLTEQLGGALAVDVVRQHHHRGARLLGTDPLGGPQPVVDVGRWHAQVGEHQVGAGPGAGGHDLVGVGGRPRRRSPRAAGPA